MAIQERTFDLRILQRNIATGITTEQDYTTWLGGLTDASANATPIEAEFVEGVLDQIRERRLAQQSLEQSLGNHADDEDDFDFDDDDFDDDEEDED